MYGDRLKLGLSYIKDKILKNIKGIVKNLKKCRPPQRTKQFSLHKNSKSRQHCETITSLLLT